MAAITAQQTAPILTREQLAVLMPDASRLLSEEPEMESSLHHEQSVILEKSLERWWKDRNDFFIGVNLSIYFSRAQLKTHDFRGPDIFIVLNTERRPRTSWVVWEEDGKYPDVIIELLSDSTAEIDRRIKKEIYQERFRTPEYFWFSVETLEFVGWHLLNDHYFSIEPDQHGWLWSDRLKLFLGVADGRLRYFTADGMLVPTPEEGEEKALQFASQATQLAEQEKQRAEQEKQRAEQEKQRAEQEKQRAEQEKQRADLLAEKLRGLGVDPDSL